MPIETLIKIVRGEDSALIATNDASKVKHLNHLGFDVGEEEDGIKYFEVPVDFIMVRKPKGGREMTDEQRASTKARLTLARAAKNPEWAKANAELVGKWANSHPEIAQRYGISSNGVAPKSSKSAKPSSSVKASTKAAAPEPAAPEAPAKSSLASRVKITR